MPNARRHPLAAIVFDLDGTLIDSAPDLQAALNRVFADTGRRSLSVEEVTGMIGDGVEKLVERALDATGGVSRDREIQELSSWVSRFLDSYGGHGADLTRAYPGVPETLKQLYERGVRLAVCTNKPQAATVEVLEKLDLFSFFGAVVGGDALNGIRKPDPRHLLATLEGLGAAPESAVMVGDLGNDVAVARAAGLPVILCRHGYARVPVEELGPDAVIDRFTDLPEALDRLA